MPIIKEKKYKKGTEPQVTNPYTTTQVMGSSSSRPSSTTPNGTPIIRKTATGQMTGVTFPDGRTFDGLTHQQVNQLVADYNKTPLTQEQQIQAEIDKTNLKKKMEAEQAPQTVTPEQLAQVGKLNPQAPLSASDAQIQSEIQRNIQSQEVINKLGSFPTPFTPPIGLIQGSAGILGSLGNAVAPGAGNKAMSELEKNRAVREFFNSYSNEKNFQSVSTNIDKSVTAINGAISMGRRATTPEEIDRANLVYNQAWQDLTNEANILKEISTSGDQREWTDKVLSKQTEIENMLDTRIGGYRYSKDQAMIAALNKKDVIDTSTFENTLYGGVQ